MIDEHPHISHLRNIPLRRIIKALKRDGFDFTERQGSQRVYRHQDGRRIVINYHRLSLAVPRSVIRNIRIGTLLSE